MCGILRRMPRPASFFALLTAAAAVLPAACYDFDEIRRGGKGESCARTDDCKSPLVCIDLTCVEPGGAGGTGGGTTVTGSTSEGGSGGTTTTTGGPGGATTTTTSEGGAGGGGSGGGTGGLDEEACVTCMDTACAPQLAACDDGCFAIEACIQMTCAYLSAIGAAQEEGLCQVQCQEPYIASKQKHINVVNCALGRWADCDPCSSYPHDYNYCAAKASGLSCQESLAACNDSNDCVQYRECVGSCATLAACLACDDTPEGQNGKALFWEYNLCLSKECLIEAWLP